MNRIIRYAYICMTIGVVISFIIQLVVSNQMMIYSDKLAYITRRIQEVEEQNDMLRKILAEQQTIKRIAEEAKKRGFIEPSPNAIITIDSASVAIKR